VLYCNTAYGDYPHYLPQGKADHLQSRFTGWMLLNYNKPVRVSSTLGSCAPNLAVDEDIKTWWSAKTANKGEWIESDLGEVSTIRAIQVNYADQDVDSSFLGKIPGTYHQYLLQVSDDGKAWKTLADKSANKTDVPHDYIELKAPVRGRYVRLTNIHIPTGKFAICGLRVFGTGNGKAPGAVKAFVPLRGDTDRRNIWMKWALSDQAQGYTIYTGTAPDKLYTSIMVYGKNEYYFKAVEKDQPYYFRIEAFNENGRGELSPLFKAE
jgi:xylan 1,4-beta-xylosidase